VGCKTRFACGSDLIYLCLYEGLRDGFAHSIRVEFWTYVWEEGCGMGPPMVAFYFILEIAVVCPVIRVHVVGFLHAARVADRRFELTYDTSGL